MPTLARAKREHLVDQEDNRFRQVKFIVTHKGERLPLLMLGDGVPDWRATVFALAEMRSRSLSTSAIEKALRAIGLFYRFIQSRQIDWQARILSGHLFRLQELDALVVACRTRSSNSEQTKPSVFDWRQPSVGRKGAFARAYVSAEVAATRLRFIRDFVIWCVRMTNPSGIDIGSTIRDFRAQVNGRMPPTRSALSEEREGLPAEHVTSLLEVVRPGAAQNPWMDEHTQKRNQLIIRWFELLGLRRGELLGVRVSDIDFREGRVTIRRRADDADDPRTQQPNAKTKARVLRLDRELLESTEHYILEHRRRFPSARKHNFLFVASKTGMPLSLSSITKLFRVLSQHPSLQKHRVFAHLLRHTWNDRFSEKMDEQRVPEETEKRVRSYLMGWSDVSKSAATYTRRHIKRKAAEASLAMQEGAIRMGRMK